MRFWASIPLLVVLALPCNAASQSMPESRIAKEAIAKQSEPIPETYSDTFRMLKAWLDTEERDELVRLFAVGDVRGPDLMAACGSEGNEIAEAAFITLQLLGKSECESCADSLSPKLHTALSCGANLTDGDFDRIEKWYAKRHTRNGFKCGKDYEPPFTPLDDSLLYALILDGSPRSKSVLNRMRALEKACAWRPTILGEILEQAQLFIAAAKGIGDTLRIEPRISESSIRGSAFYLPTEYREDSKVEVLARNTTGDRILLEVSYRCGRLCGSGYYVVLRKDGPAWHYAVIRMAWIS